MASVLGEPSQLRIVCITGTKTRICLDIFFCPAVEDILIAVLNDTGSMAFILVRPVIL